MSEAEPKVPPVDFISFVLSLAASAQIHMGLIEDPEQKKKEAKLPLAQQTIDVLGILQEKTKGNLTEEEAEILEEILHSLRLQFIEVKKGEKG